MHNRWENRSILQQGTLLSSAFNPTLSHLHFFFSQPLCVSAHFITRYMATGDNVIVYKGLIMFAYVQAYLKEKYLIKSIYNILTF